MKTVALRCVFGLVAVLAGAVGVFGVASAFLYPMQAIYLAIGAVGMGVSLVIYRELYPQSAPRQ